MTKPITIELLKEHKACKDQVAKFKKLFGEEIIPTRELCLLHAQDFNFGWARCLLDKSVWSPFEKVVSSVWNVCYGEFDNLSWDAEIIAYVGKVYKETIALAWFDSWESQNNV